jgi:hypothetical protein
MSHSKILMSGVVLALAAGVVVPRSASAGPAESRLVEFVGWTLRVFTPPDPCHPPDPCKVTLQTEIAPRQHADLIQSFLVGHHTDAGRAFHPEFQLATEESPPDPCRGDAACPPGPPVDQFPPGPPGDQIPPGPPSDVGAQPPGPPGKIAVRFDVVDPARAAVLITIPSGYALQGSVDASGRTAYTLAPTGMVNPVLPNQ